MSVSVGAGATCGACGLQARESGRFCSECGAALGEPLRESRRMVTVLFADIVESTALGEHLDPETLRTVLHRFFVTARDAVRAHGGTVEKFIGDAVLAVFGVPELHEDDALRAVRAAQRLRTDLDALDTETRRAHDVPLQARLGIATGPVVVGGARAGGGFVTGAAVNTAALLQQAAPPGQILLDSATHRLVQHVVDAIEVGPLSVRGRAHPVPAYRLVQLRPGLHHRHHHRFVGRDAELARLVTAWRDTCSTGRGRVITVVGEPGIGKTRLMMELVDHLGDRDLGDAPRIWTGQCLAYGHSVTYRPVLQLLRAAAGLAESAPPAAVRRALLGLGGPPDHSHHLAVDLVLPLLGAQGTAGTTDETAWAIGHLLARSTRGGPAVIIVDDLHWAQPALVGVLERLRAETASHPLMLIVGARPELLADNPTWESLALRLEPLDTESVQEYLTQRLGSAPPPSVVATLATRTNGNPLFLAEMTSALVDSKALALRDGDWWLDPGADDAVLPDTVHAVLGARLVRLPEDERRLLEGLSVAGQSGGGEEAEVLQRGRVDDLTLVAARLAARGMLEVSAEGGWAFRHALVRDAAYAHLPRGERILLHQRLAGHLLDDDDATASSHRWASAAHHLAQAARHAIALAPRSAVTADLVDRAGRTGLTAARAARDRADLSASYALTRDVLSLPLSTRGEREALTYAITSGHLPTLDEGVALASRLAASHALAPRPSELEVSLLRLIDWHHQWQSVGKTSQLTSPEAAETSVAVDRLASVRGGDPTVLRFTLQQQIEQSMDDLAQRERCFQRLLAAGDGWDRRRATSNWLLDLESSASMSRIIDHCRRAPTAEQNGALRSTFELAALAARRARGEPALGFDAAERAAAADVLRFPSDLITPQTLIHVHWWLGNWRAAAHWNMYVVDGMIERHLRMRAATYLGAQIVLGHRLGQPPDETAQMLQQIATLTPDEPYFSHTIGHALLASDLGEVDRARDLAERGLAATAGRPWAMWRAEALYTGVVAARACDDVSWQRRLLVELRDLHAARELVGLVSRTRHELDELDNSTRDCS